MNHRERVRSALNHSQPDRVPMDIGGIASTIIDSAYYELKDHLEVTATDDVVWEDWAVAARISGGVLEALGADFRHLRMQPPDNWEPKMFDDGSWTNEWGTVFKRVGDYAEMIDFPLEEVDDLEKIHQHSWPDPYAPGRTRGLKEHAEELYENTNYALATFDIARLFEWAQWVRGMDTFLKDMVARPEFAEVILDKVLEVQIGLMDVYLDAVGDYIEVVWTGDDLGTQKRTLISPNMYREYLKPRHTKLFNFIKSKTSAKVAFHTDGNVFPLLDDLVEAGIDVLNPVQPLAKNMDHSLIKKRYGDQLSFWGGVDVQSVLPRGTPEDVEKEVKRVLGELGTNGGLILAPTHNFQPDVPPENIVALYEAGQEFGRYPLNISGNDLRN